MNVEVSEIISMTKDVIHKMETENRFYGKKVAEFFFQEYGKLECASNPEVFVSTLGIMFDRFFKDGADAALDAVCHVKRRLEEEGKH